MIVYVVTHKKLNRKRCGYFKGIYCYVMNFLQYHESAERGYVFATAKQALNFMLKVANMYGGKK